MVPEGWALPENSVLTSVAAASGYKRFMPRPSIASSLRLFGSAVLILACATLMASCANQENSSASGSPKKQIEHKDPMGGPSTFTYQ